MNSLDIIRAANRNLAAQAWAEGREPFLVEREDIEDWLDILAAGQIPVFPFRLVGEHVRDRWEVTNRTLAVNKNSTGGGGGFALDLNAMVSSLRPGLGYALIQDSDSWATLAEYRLTGNNRAQALCDGGPGGGS